MEKLETKANRGSWDGGKKFVYFLLDLIYFLRRC